MKKTHSIILFNQKQVRRFYDEEKEIWYFSIIDVVDVLTDTTIPRRYWSDLKNKLKNEGSEVYEKIVQLKMFAPDGKQRETDCFSTEDLLRVIQSIPSPKAEPFKLWLAKVEYAILTDEITRAWADKSVRDYKKFKGLKKENLRDNMTNLEFLVIPYAFI